MDDQPRSNRVLGEKLIDVFADSHDGLTPLQQVHRPQTPPPEQKIGLPAHICHGFIAHLPLKTSETTPGFIATNIEQVKVANLVCCVERADLLVRYKKGFWIVSLL